MLIKNGNVLLFEENGFVKRDLRVRDGKIQEIGENLAPEQGEELLEAEGKYVTPGLIDAHSHICVSEEGMGAIGDDCNDYSDALMPYLDTLDAINPFDLAVKSAVEAGVTAACTCPGSDSVIGGMCSVISLTGTVAEDMLLKGKAAIKCSFGENPKNAGYGFKSRMGNAWLLRKCIEDALEYRHHKEEAEKSGSYFRTDIGMENMLPLLNREIPLHAHVHRADDICTAIRIAREYNLRLVLVHCTDGVSVLNYLKQFDYPVILGPTINPRSKLECMAKRFETAGIMSRAGIKVCLTADHDVTPIYYLPVYGAQAVKAGLDEVEGLKALTRNPAEVLGIDDRKGEIKEGKDADLVIWSGRPFDSCTKAETVFIMGKKEAGN
ncbi:MAG: amidohydrolase family protein [Clostridium sp.]|nr:amidohydrolase family protein [Clostridium sp.]MEE1498084.1 amidohydrolase family protein [Clostridium sp.]